MKYSNLLFLVSFFLLFSCDKKDITDSNSVNDSTVYFLQPEGPCCSNIQIINQEPVFSHLAGYSESILFAVNMEDFSSLEISPNDSLKIQYLFSSADVSCKVICDRHNGIPIELLSIEKL